MQRQARRPDVSGTGPERAGYGDILLNRQDMQITRIGAARMARPTIRGTEHIGGLRAVARHILYGRRAGCSWFGMEP